VKNYYGTEYEARALNGLEEPMGIYIYIYIYIYVEMSGTHNIVFKHPVALIYSSFTHYTPIHNATCLLSPSLSTTCFGRIRPSSGVTIC
jgi:hypothetical protein